MTYTAKRTVIAGQRYAPGDTIPADALSEKDAARLLDLGAIEEVAANDAAPTPPRPAAVPDNDLRVAMINAINDLPGDAFTSSGKPKVEAIEAALPGYAEQIDAALRDAVWEEMKAAATAAP